MNIKKIFHKGIATAGTLVLGVTVLAAGFLYLAFGGKDELWLFLAAGGIMILASFLPEGKVL